MQRRLAISRNPRVGKKRFQSSPSTCAEAFDRTRLRWVITVATVTGMPARFRARMGIAEMKSYRSTARRHAHNPQTFAPPGEEVEATRSARQSPPLEHGLALSGLERAQVSGGIASGPVEKKAA